MTLCCNAHEQILSISHCYFPHLVSLHPAGDPEPSPVSSLTGSVTEADSEGFDPTPAAAPWLQPEDDPDDRCLSHCLNEAAKAAALDLNPTPPSVASAGPEFYTLLPEPEAENSEGYDGCDKT